MGQTSYSLNAPAALPGLISDIGPHEIVSKKAEGTIPFGYAVSRGTDADNQVAAGGTAPIGVAVRDLHREISDAGNTEYVDLETAAIMRKGYIWVTIAATTGVPGATLYSVDATGAIEIGTAGAGQTQLTGWSLENTVASAGDLGLIRVEE